jgi:hypothetical protein
MKNSHVRFGRLEFTRRLRDTTTQVRLVMDRFIGETGERGGTGRGHLMSVVGGDQDVGAIWAGVVENDFFAVSGPGLEPMTIAFGEGAQCFRGTLTVGSRKRPFRHLIVASAEMAGKIPENAKVIRTIMCDSDAGFVLYRLAARLGLPVVPEWAGWFRTELERRKAVAPLIGIGCAPVAVKASKKALLKWIGRAVKRGELRFPEQNGPVVWSVPNNFLGLRPAHEGEEDFGPEEVEMAEDTGMGPVQGVHWEERG